MWVTIRRSALIRALLLGIVCTLALGGSCSAASEHVRILDTVLGSMRRYYWDTGYRGLDWAKLSAETRSKVDEAPTLEEAMSEVAALLAGLHDHHTRLEAPGSDDTGSSDVYGGIGCLLALKTQEGYCLVSEVFAKTPAEEAGLVGGDRIWAVDGKQVRDFVAQNRHPVEAIRGAVGTKVILSVEKAGGTRTELSLQRRQIVHEKRVTTRKLGRAGEYGYITFDNFYDQVSKQVLAGLKELSGTKGLILDMRDNPGGLIRELVQVSGYLGIRDLGRAVSRDGTTYYRTTWVLPVYTKPLIVLVNGNTASSAEILSTAAKESGRATLVGQPTGNGTAVAVSVPIGSGYEASITTAQFFTAKGRAYDTPTAPDVTVPEPTEEDIRAGRDACLDRAIEVMDGLVKSSSGAAA